MDIVNQKLGSVGGVHASIVDGKLVVGVDADLDLVAQLEKLRLAHQTGLIGTALMGLEGAIKNATASASATPAAPATPSA